MENKLLFHGTNEEYHNQMVKKYGVYRHEGLKRIILTDQAKLAQHYAEVRAEEWKGWQAILVVYKERVPNIQITQGDIHPSCPELHPDWYDFVPAIRPLEQKV